MKGDMAQNTQDGDGGDAENPTIDIPHTEVTDENPMLTNAEEIKVELPPKKEPKADTVEVKIDEPVKSAGDGKVKLTFASSELFKKEIKKKTADAPADDDDGDADLFTKEARDIDTSEEIGEGKLNLQPTTEVQQKKAPDFKKEDYDLIAEFIIETFDWTVSGGFMILAKDTTDAPYRFDKSRKELLAKQLSLILQRSSKKMTEKSWGWVFGLTVILSMIKPTKKAIANRKMVNEGEKAKAKFEAEQRRLERIKREEEAKKEEVKVEPKTEEAVIKEEVAEAVKEEVKQEPEKVEPVIKDEPKVEEEPSTTEQLNEVLEKTGTKIDLKSGAIVPRRKRGSSRQRINRK